MVNELKQQLKRMIRELGKSNMFSKTEIEEALEEDDMREKEKQNNQSKIRDYPKLESPFVRKLIDINGKEEYVITDEITPGAEWVFEGGEDVVCTEKCNGSNCSIIIENGIITSIWNRKERLPFFNKGKAHFIEGVYEAYLRGFCELPDGQHFGELCGPKINGNDLKLEKHLWIPFNTYCREHLAYKSWHKYPKSFKNINEWFLNSIKDGGIFSLFMRKKGIEQKPEGVVFHNLKTGQMYKLRLDMMPKFEGKRHNDEFKKEDIENVKMDKG